MKKIYTVIIAAAGLLAAACTDLSPEVYTDVRKEDYFKTPAQFSTLIANAYSQLAGGTTPACPSQCTPTPGAATRAT